MPKPTAPERIELVEEQLEITEREVERGRVVVRVHVDHREEMAEATLRQEEAFVERVAINLPVDAVPAVREVDGVLIVPVVEEQIVVQTRLILKEELHITRQDRFETVRQPVRLRSERAEVVRVKGSGDTTSDLDKEGIDDE